MLDGHLIVAYHGCDATTRDDLVSGRLPRLDASTNQYDWLGSGVYFFEGDHARALRFAEASAGRPNELLTARPVATAAVVGALLSVRHCLDMTTQDGLLDFDRGHRALKRLFKAKNIPLPKNRKAGKKDADVIVRQLDDAVFTHIHETRAERSDVPDYQLVRGAFRQGKPIAPNSGFHFESHIQIALRDPTCIVGWFLPEGAQLLSSAEYDAAVRARDAVRRARRKPQPTPSAVGTTG